MYVGAVSTTTIPDSDLCDMEPPSDACSMATTSSKEHHTYMYATTLACCWGTSVDTVSKL